MSVERVEELLWPVLGDHREILDCHVRRLTSPGENYGSLILALDVTIKTKDGGATEIFNLVAKLIPPNEFLQRLFNIQTTFRNELELYKTVIPTLQEFQKRQGGTGIIDITPKYYSSRLSLDPHTDKIDDDAVLLLENLKSDGYVNIDCTVGCDLEISKLMVKSLAQLHAVSLGLKLRKPDLFDAKIKPYLSQWRMESVAKDLVGKFVKKIVHLVASIDDCARFVDRVQTVLGLPLQKTPREPFATVIHNDFWSNNALVKFSGDEPVSVKIVDFQVVEYGSPAKDLVFFLFTSVNNEVCERYCDDLIKLYHDTFLEVLRDLKCDVEQFSFEAFQKEMDFEARNSQFFHVTWMISPIFAKRDHVKDITEVVETDFASGEATDLAKEKLAFVVRQFAERNWI